MTTAPFLPMDAPENLEETFQRLDDDLRLFGVMIWKTNPDGSVERISPEDVYPLDEVA